MLVSVCGRTGDRWGGGGVGGRSKTLTSRTLHFPLPLLPPFSLSSIAKDH